MKSFPVALVTGAGRRLGRQIALALGQNGFNVVVNFNSSRKEAQSVVNSIRGYGRSAIAVKADVSKRNQVMAMMKKVISSFGRIDLLVNNAAIFIDGDLKTTSERSWDKTLDINLKGPFLCAQAAAQHMLKQKGGRIINIASLGGIQAWKHHLPYSVSKAGVIMLTRIMAKDLAPTIMVNAIAPGTVIIEGEEDVSIKHIPIKNIPLQRYGNPDDITNVVIFLATKASYITGQIITVDGGRGI